MDLRETKGWSYGVRGTTQLSAKLVPVHRQCAGAGGPHGRFDPRAAEGHSRRSSTTKGITDEEMQRTIANRVSQLPGSVRDFGRGAVGDAARTRSTAGPTIITSCWRTNIARRRKATINASLRDALDPSGFVWVVVGDAAKVKPQLAKLNLPIEEVQPR